MPAEAISEGLSLWGLFASSFLAATLLPGGSEAVLWGVLSLHPGLLWPALGLATLGNTLGGMTSYLVGRLLAKAAPPRGMKWVQRYGPAALALAWVPVIGDAICVAAGWLRANPWWSFAFMAAGKFARYFVIAYAAG
jgi:membrane protein YqaA with SNARE-associated domain